MIPCSRVSGIPQAMVPCRKRQCFAAPVAEMCSQPPCFLNPCSLQGAERAQIHAGLRLCTAMGWLLWEG